MMTTTTDHAPSNAELCSAVLDWLAPRRSANTIYGYRQSYLALLRAVDTPFDRVTTDQLDQWLRRPRRNGADPAPATIKRELAALRALWKYLLSRGHVTADPTALLLEDAPRVNNEQPKPIDLKVWRKVWHADLDDASRVLLGFGCFVGLRRAEIASLVPAQLDLREQRLVNVRRKGGKRQGFMFGSCLDIYERRLGDWIGDADELFRQPLKRLADQRANRPALLPFADERSARHVTRTIHVVNEGVVNPDLCGKRLNRILSDVGQPAAFTLHQLRHSFCTNLIHAGIPIEVVSQLAGHSSLDITRRYVELGDDPLARFLVDPTEGLAVVNRWG